MARLLGRTTTPALRACVEALDATAPRDSRELAALLAWTWREKRPRRVGLAGGQGTGKSTLARLIEQACHHVGLRAVVLSLDDYYLPRARRLAFAARVHPLFETRGPPGTHDVVLLREQLLALGRPGSVDVPTFDKGRDDRSGTRRVVGPFELIVLEGWCVGAKGASDAALAEPCNALERELDREGVWRRRVNEGLAGDYGALWALLESIVYLKAPDLAAIRRWRLEQEGALPPEQRKDAAAIDRFVAHYERITLDMSASLPDWADWTIELAPDHSIAAIVRGGSKARAPG